MPIVGKLGGIMPSAIQACLDRYSLSVEPVKYTSWRVVRTSPEPCDDIPSHDGEEYYSWYIHG